MKKILFIFLVAFSLFSCCEDCKKQESTEKVLGTTMQVEWTLKNASMIQVDSLIKADTLPEFSRWLGSSFTDFNTNEKITKRLYIKYVSDKVETVYLIVGNNEPFEIIKRVEKK